LGQGSVIGRRLELPAVRADGTELQVELTVTRIELPGPAQFTGILRDLTAEHAARRERERLLEREREARREAERARAGLEFLVDAGATLAASLEEGEAMDRIARLLVPRLAEWCAIDLVAPDGTIRRAAVAHIEVEEWATIGAGRSGSLVEEAIRDGEPRLIPALEPLHGERLGTDVDVLELRCAGIFPLLAHDTTLGALVVARRNRYDDDEIALLRELASRASVALQNARLYEDRTYVARTLQRSLLPTVLPEVPGLEVAVRYRAAGEGNEVGGDFYDVFALADGTWCAAIGDVGGKGPDAAALTGLARHTLRTAGMREHRPAELLRTLNEAIVREGTERLCTVSLTRIRPTEGAYEITIACGGHPSPLLLRSDGEVVRPSVSGTLLGAIAEPQIGEVTMSLASGDSLVSFTDGLIDESGAGRLSIEEAVAILRTHAGEAAEGLVDAVEGAALRAKSEPPRDDIALLCLRVLP
ncbi:MAG TPA: GAF domain-containing SpoIIE family protein phosphatase, partial [Actinomycetota bacterium]|nr:GAF domain-containing SpoIIE family protein phosphatase [Actinomycetota bacterium]